MSSKKFLLVKGRAGMGNRILCLLGAILYAQITDRKLSIDWSDEAYSHDRSNIFPRLFSIENMEYITEIPKKSSVFPSIWIGNLEKSFEDLIDIYNIRETYLGTAIAILMSRYSVNIAYTHYQEDLLVRWSYVADIHRLRRLFKGEFSKLSTLDDKTILKRLLKKHLVLEENIQKKVNNFKCEFFKSDIIIGVHIRYTDRKNPFKKYYQFINKILHVHPQAEIFLATDSKEVEKHFKDLYGSRVYSINKWFPSETSHLARLHFNPDCPDKLENAIQALVDIYLLASCNYLVCDQTSTFSIVAELISDLPKNNIIDTSLYHWKTLWRRSILLAERWF